MKNEIPVTIPALFTQRSCRTYEVSLGVPNSWFQESDKEELWLSYSNILPTALESQLRAHSQAAEVIGSYHPIKGLTKLSIHLQGYQDDEGESLITKKLDQVLPFGASYNLAISKISF
jgi:hypothetical protein